MKLWKKKSSPPPPLPSFTSIPDEIVVDIFARVPRSYYRELSLVSKSLRSILSSPELYAARSRLGNIEKCLYLCLWDCYNGRNPIWFTLWINPNRDVNVIKKRKKKKAGALLVSIPSSNLPYVPEPTVVGSEIYVIGGGEKFNKGAPSSDVRVLDCRSNTWRDAPSMNVAREDARTYVYDEKIYVMGGGKEDGPWGEVFDTKTQSWECLPDPCSAVRNLPHYRIAEFDGKIYFGNEKKMYAYTYDTKQGKWERCDGMIATRFPRSGCVIDNVSYFYGEQSGFYGCCWYDVKDGKWKEVKGIESLEEKYKSYDGASICSWTRVVSFGGKLLTIWEEYNEKSNLCLWDSRNLFHKNMKIWCAEISLKKPHRGEVWGNVEWVDVVGTAPVKCNVLHCVAASV